MYAELKCKTNFSFLDGSSHPEELVERAVELHLHGLALTDLNGVYGMPKGFWKAKHHPQLKFIVGSEVRMENHDPLTLLCRDRGAYAVMCRILTTAHHGKEKGKAFLKMSELVFHLEDSRAKNLICLAPNSKNAPYNILKELFEDRLYLCLSRFNDGFDKERFESALEIKNKFEIPWIATNDVLYHAKHRRKLQDAVTCIREGVTLTTAGYKLRGNAERYLKSPLEMKLLFKNCPEALRATVEIADSCTFSPSELRYRYPSEWIPAGYTAQTYLENLVWKGGQKIYKDQIPPEVVKQIHHEFELIQQLGFADYFLTIYDIVDFARKKNILCQGRGSAANSVICYCLGITAIDPIQMNLLFERFISVERNEPPDIDVDFEHERREEVIQYIYEKYGRDRAAMVSCISTYRGRSAFRELAKVFDVEVGTLSAKKVERDFENLSKTSAIPQLKDQISSLAEEMNTFPRHLSIHSGGFTLSADPIIEIVPVEPARMEGRTIVQWDKYDLDYLGLLKVDVLSLGMLTAIRKALDLTGLSLYDIPPEDPETYEMIQKADTVGTFQVESRAQMNMSGRLLPKTFYDLVIQVAIVRPGPIVGKMVHPYLRRRRGEEKVEYPHPKLKQILSKTLGVPLFQEQVMKIAVELGGFSPGEADTLRRAIAAWRSSGDILKVGERLIQGLLKNGIPLAWAERIFEQLKGFASYGFPESHAASFAILSYASCYLKKKYPAEFACSVVNSQPMGFYASHTILDDAKRHGAKILPLDPEKSQWDCTMEEGAIRLGLRLVKGLSQKAASQILEQRPYQNLKDFLVKNKIRTEVLNRLAMSGFFKMFGGDQRHTLWQILADAQGAQDQMDLFNVHSYGREENLFSKLNDFEETAHDYCTISFSEKHHPMEALRKLKTLPRTNILQAKNTPHGKWITTSGLLLVRQKPPTAGGVTFGAIEDEFGILDITLFKGEYEKYKEIFLHNCFLIVSGILQRDGYSVNLLVKSLAAVWKENDPRQLVVEPTQYFW